jgi:hypothetical protein
VMEKSGKTCVEPPLCMFVELSKMIARLCIIHILCVLVWLL